MPKLVRLDNNHWEKGSQDGEGQAISEISADDYNQSQTGLESIENSGIITCNRDRDRDLCDEKPRR